MLVWYKKESGKETVVTSLSFTNKKISGITDNSNEIVI